LVLDLCVVVLHGDEVTGYLVLSYNLPALLDQVGASGVADGNDLMLLEPDGTRVAHGSLRAGVGVYRASRMVDLPGAALQLQLESPARRPRLVPDVMSVFVVSLSLALIGVVTTLAIDMRRRAGAEAALADALSFRKAVEDSLVTGLRARDLEGRITYANPAFCAMVGFAANELIGSAMPPYWPPEQRLAYQERRASRLASSSRDTFETTFMRKGGERFPAMVFEAPLIGATGRHTGWVSAVVDLSAQRRVEEIARQQQERLQATARLATAGEMASLLSHELTQPLSAIAAYATGTLNMLVDDAEGGVSDAELRPLMKEGLAQIAEQAGRAGRVIKSVHNFVRRRDGSREATAVADLVEAVLPLIRLQARKSQARIEVDIATGIPPVLCDRAMVEQVLLNLARNGLQAMQSRPADNACILTLRARAESPERICLSVHDRGDGIDERTAAQLFQPFFTTRADGMGLGLSVCRSIIEQHGGTLAFVNARDAAGRIAGVEFSFTLPAAGLAPRRDPAQVAAEGTTVADAPPSPDLESRQ
jgi:two-component system sensor histidine kinase DctS